MVPMVTLLYVISSICFATAASPKEEKTAYVANFNYTPDSQAAPGSSGVIFAMAKVGYKSDSKTPWFTYPQFDNLDKAIKQDLPELLTAKGFTVRGPFDSYDLIPYSDKKAIDLFLIPTLELLITLKEKHYMSRIESIWAQSQTPITLKEGNAEVSGKINLELREIVTGELMWAKSIPFEQFESPCSASTPCYFEGGRFGYSLIMNDVVRGIEQQYPNLMATIAKLIDPEEMRIIKKQAQELKSKKGY